eukprot:Hpha_TRINITY_DN18527_c0_g1::TRINITY_DN18527_c0_g1_i1::g.195265::m.195265/K06889/K06889; uncharacterized protein
MNRLWRSSARALSVPLRKQRVGARRFWAGVDSGVFFLAQFFGVSYVGAAILFVLLQRKILYPRNLLPPDDPSKEAKRLGGSVIRTPSGGAGLWLPPRHPGGKVLMYFHGNADQLAYGPLYLAGEVERAGLGLLAVEYPGYGVLKDSGMPTEASVLNAARSMLQHATKPTAEGGLGLRTSDIYVVGQSLGGGPAMDLAAREARLGGLVLISPFESITRMAVAAFPMFGPLVTLCPVLVSDKYANDALAPSVRIPSLVLHGRYDDIVPLAQGMRVAQLLPQCTPLVVEAGHNDILTAEVL